MLAAVRQVVGWECRPVSGGLGGDMVILLVSVTGVRLAVGCAVWACRRTGRV